MDNINNTDREYHRQGVNMIKLLIVGGWWTTYQYVNGKPDPALIELFGTHIIPTAFNERMPINEVIAIISKLNPDKAVVLG